MTATRLSAGGTPARLRPRGAASDWPRAATSRVAHSPLPTTTAPVSRRSPADPGGRPVRLVATRHEPHLQGQERPTYDLYVVAANGSGLRRMTDHPEADSDRCGAAGEPGKSRSRAWATCSASVPTVRACGGSHGAVARRARVGAGRKADCLHAGPRRVCDERQRPQADPHGRRHAGGHPTGRRCSSIARAATRPEGNSRVATSCASGEGVQAGTPRIPRMSRPIAGFMDYDWGRRPSAARTAPPAPARRIAHG